VFRVTVWNTQMKLTTRSEIETGNYINGQLEVRVVTDVAVYGAVVLMSSPLSPTSQKFASSKAVRSRTGTWSV
jgi:hypothetical protein